MIFSKSRSEQIISCLSCFLATSYGLFWVSKQNHLSLSTFWKKKLLKILKVLKFSIEILKQFLLHHWKNEDGLSGVTELHWHCSKAVPFKCSHKCLLVLSVTQIRSEEGRWAPVCLFHSTITYKAKKYPISRRLDVCFVTADVDLRQFQNIQGTLDNIKEGRYHSRNYTL